MTVPVLVDHELLVTTYLREHPAVAALTDQVMTRTPDTLIDPWVRVTLLDDTPEATSRVLHLTTGLLQLDCYAGEPAAGAQEEANLLARTVRGALHAMPAATHDGAVVTSVKFTGPRRIPDTDLEPPRERYILDARVTAHPA